MQRILDEHSHHVPAQEVLSILDVNVEKGLDRFEVEHRRERFGFNVLTEKKGQSPWVRFLLQFHQPLVYTLLAAVLITAWLKEYVDSGVIFGVVLVNAIVGFLQEAKALQAIQSLSKSLTSIATVIRSSKKTQVDAKELVPGDIVLLQSGDRVPADLRLVQVRDLQIDESALTGEAVPASKNTEPLDRYTPLGDRKNLGFSSTLVTYGTGTGVVVAIGDQTEIGQISEMISSAQVLQTPLTKKIHQFSNRLLVAVLVLAGLTFLAGILHGQKPLEIFMASVALAVGLIPEGLPAAVTIIMAIGVSRMARRRAIIRRLPAVETLGSTTVICSDKTGTLTQNQMTVIKMFVGGKTFDVSGVGYHPVGVISENQKEVTPPSTLKELLRCGILCNDAQLLETEDLWKVQGDPTEGALLSVGIKGGFSLEQERQQWKRIDLLPFESEHQYMATLHETPNSKERRVFVKGSLEKLIQKSQNQLSVSGETPLQPKIFQNQAEKMAREGLRVLAFAYKDFSAKKSHIQHSDIDSGLVFIGLQGMMDPPREEAAQAIAACQTAGIHVKMITGDHASTAASIARQLGINHSHDEKGNPKVLTGYDLEKMSDDDLVKCIEEIPIFARVSPSHKLQIVEALQAKEHVVAMTGDGVNDAPALKKANIGVAMALGGTEVAREAADMVLTDDNFASIEAAVEEGRGVFDNLQKFIVWTLPTNGGEALVLLASIVLGISLPILPVQILWINMMTAIFLGMMLAFEPKESGIMKRRPNQKNQPILSKELLGRVFWFSLVLSLAVFGVFEWQLTSGASMEEARTAAVAMLVVGEMFYLFNCRSFKHFMSSSGWFSNPWVWVGSFLMVAFQFLFTYVGVFNRLFQSAPLGLISWLVIFGFGLILFLMVAIEKKIRG